METDPYAYWRAALRRDFSLWVDEPQPGFYRRKLGKGGGFRPVAIWLENGEVKCLDGDQLRPSHHVWDSCAFNPITEAAYRARVAGQLFPDERSVEGSSETTTNVERAALIGPRRTTNGNRSGPGSGPGSNSPDRT